MEMHAGIHAEIHEPVIDEIKHREGILSVGVCIEVKPYGVFPLNETKGRLRVNGPDTRFHLRNGMLHLIVPRLDAHADPSLPWTLVVTARQHVSQLLHEAFSFFTKLAKPSGAIKYFIRHYNLMKAPALYG